MVVSLAISLLLRRLRTLLLDSHELYLFPTFLLKIMVGDIAVGTSNSEYPRLNVHNKLRRGGVP